jgi:predicted Zn-dependent protease
MRDRSAFFAACCIAATALSAILAGCDSSESDARQAYAEYQAASAAGDLPAARIALLELVNAKDDDPTYWEELGRVQLQFEDYQGAYYAFTRAQELDRGNVATLATLTQLALLSGNADTAERHARQLELVAPGHPAVKLAYGYIYLKRQDYDKADERVNSLLAAFPYEPGAKLLKARILLARQEPDQAIDVLEQQIKVRQDDAGSLKALMMLYERQNDWQQVARVATRLRDLNSKDPEFGITVVDASLRSHDFAAARRASEPLLAPDAPARQVDAVLRLWADRWRSPDAIAEAERLAGSAGAEQRLAYATYFNAVGKPEVAADLVGDAPKLPLNLGNLSVNSVIATSFALKGDRAEAKRLFDRILEREPDHVYALRGRINLEIATGDAKAAIIDAQRLVSVEPRSARDRLLLARAFAVAGDGRQVDRTLWNAFHDLEGNFETYEALRAHVERTDGPDAAAAVDEEFKQQRDVALAREFI